VDPEAEGREEKGCWVVGIASSVYVEISWEDWRGVDPEGLDEDDCGVVGITSRVYVEQNVVDFGVSVGMRIAG